MLRLAFLIVFFCGSVANQTFADNYSDSDGLALLKQALKKEKEWKSEYTLEIKKVGNRSKQSEIYYKRTPDGLLLERAELKTINAGPTQHEVPPVVTLRNRTGDWSLRLHKRAIHMKYVQDTINAAREIDPDYDAIPVDVAIPYATKLIDSNNRKLVEISIRVPDSFYEQKLRDREVINAQYKERVISETGQSRQLFANTPTAEDVVPYVYTFAIDPATATIWSAQRFRKSGELISEHTFTEIKRNIELSDDFFEVPKNYEIWTANTVGEYIKYLTLTAK